MTSETPTAQATIWQRMNTPLEGAALDRAKIIVAINVVGWTIALSFSAGRLIGVLSTVASLR